MHRLGKSVPHGSKGQELLEDLYKKDIPIPRAVWYLRVLGGNETVRIYRSRTELRFTLNWMQAPLRNKPQYNPTQYSVDWTNVVVGYLKKQLGEITLPSAPRLGMSVKSAFRGVLADQASRDTWVARFTYRCVVYVGRHCGCSVDAWNSTQLLQAFYAEGLVDHRAFLAWLVQLTTTCNLAQLGFVAHLADEYLEGMLVCRALTRPFVEACVARLAEVSR